MKNQNPLNKNKIFQLLFEKIHWQIRIPVLLVFFLLINMTVIGIFYFQNQQVYANPAQYSILVDLANQERKDNGLNPLNYNDKLYFAALDKAKDILEDDYFDHYSPDGKTPWDFINATGYKYMMAGENLAIDFKTYQGTHIAWMNSSSHRSNILKAEYEEVGIASVKGEFDGRETIVSVEMFAKPQKPGHIINKWIWNLGGSIFE